MEPIIIAKDLKKFYHTANVKIKALNGVDLEIMPGESCAILGTSGSGKSTLLSLLAGLEAPTAGKIYIKKQPIHMMTEKELVDFRLLHIGFVFQSFNLMGTMNAVENVALPLMFRGVSRTTRNMVAKKLLVQMGLKQQLYNRPLEMSGGQQQRVSIARAIISKPEIIFADEPTGNLDSATSVQIMDIISKVARDRGATLVFVTHDVEKAAYADKLIHLTDGKIDNITINTDRKIEQSLN
ncbi:ABC transporter ATP-binding protein [Christensenellaceae bacterium OttesenSCG-928-K19]|nr:ABC transporter ATP-binding protein [Christensenellaceae bacterium OttesenSCG-928-K19]